MLYPFHDEDAKLQLRSSLRVSRGEAIVLLSPKHYFSEYELEGDSHTDAQKVASLATMYAYQDYLLRIKNLISYAKERNIPIIVFAQNDEIDSYGGYLRNKAYVFSITNSILEDAHARDNYFRRFSDLVGGYIRKYHLIGSNVITRNKDDLYSGIHNYIKTLNPDAEEINDYGFILKPINTKSIREYIKRYRDAIIARMPESREHFNRNPRRETYRDF